MASICQGLVEKDGAGEKVFVLSGQANFNMMINRTISIVKAYGIIFF